MSFTSKVVYTDFHAIYFTLSILSQQVYYDKSAEVFEYGLERKSDNNPTNSRIKWTYNGYPETWNGGYDFLSRNHFFEAYMTTSEPYRTIKESLIDIYSKLGSNSSNVIPIAPPPKIDQFPVFSDVSLPPTTNQLVKFSGVVNDDKGLKKITMLIINPRGESKVGFSVPVNPISNTINLNNYYFDPNNENYGRLPGTYHIAIWVEDTASQKSSHEFTIVADIPSNNTSNNNGTNTTQDSLPTFSGASLPENASSDIIKFSGSANDDKGLSKITMLVYKPNGQEVEGFSVDVSGKTKNLNDFYFDPKSTKYANASGIYTVALWIKDTSGQAVNKVFKVNVDTPPTFSGASLPENASSNIIKFSGSANDDKGLSKITMLVYKPNGQEVEGFSVDVSGKTKNLNDFYFDPKSTKYANASGIYTVALWIKDTSGQAVNKVFKVNVN